MPTKVEITDHWTDTGRKVFLAEVKVATDLLRNLPRLMIEVPDQGNVEANIQEARRSLQRDLLGRLRKHFRVRSD